MYPFSKIPSQMFPTQCGTARAKGRHFKLKLALYLIGELVKGHTGRFSADASVKRRLRGKSPQKLAAR